MKPAQGGPAAGAGARPAAWSLLLTAPRPCSHRSAGTDPHEDRLLEGILPLRWPCTPRGRLRTSVKAVGQAGEGVLSGSVTFPTRSQALGLDQIIPGPRCLCGQHTLPTQDRGLSRLVDSRWGVRAPSTGCPWSRSLIFLGYFYSRELPPRDRCSLRWSERTGQTEAMERQRQGNHPHSPRKGGFSGRRFRV